MKNEFLPKVTLSEECIEFNNEAVETMNLDQEKSRVIVIEFNNPSRKKNPHEIIIMKVNNSILDSNPDLGDIVTPEKIKGVTLEVNKKTGENIGKLAITKDIYDVMKSRLGENNEFKLIPYNADNREIKDFKSSFEIVDSSYRVVSLTDTRSSLGKEKEIVETSNKERLKL